MIEKLFQFAEISQKSPSQIYSFSIVLHPEQNKQLSLKDLLEYKYPINGNKYNKFADLPEILIISFTRGIVGKNVIKTKVSFTEELNLDPYIDNEIMKKKDNKYKLYAINERYGQFKSQGHFVSYTKINKQWNGFSDFYVYPYQYDDDEPNFKSSDVFGLYYTKQ